MAFIDKMRECRATLTGAESVASLDAMLDFFGDGRNWTKDVYTSMAGGRCLDSAANFVSVTSIDSAKHYLRRAIDEVAPGMTIEGFNDTRETFNQVVAVITRARELAMAAQVTPPPRPVPVRALPAPSPERALVGEVLPPVWPAPAPVREVALAPWAAPASVPVATRQATPSLWSALWGGVRENFRDPATRPDLRSWHD
jgi:hypothetical protein